MANIITIASILIVSAYCVPVHDFSKFYRIAEDLESGELGNAGMSGNYRNEMVNMVDDMARHYGGGRARAASENGHLFVPQVVRPKKPSNIQRNRNLRRKMFSRFHRRH